MANGAENNPEPRAPARTPRGPHLLVARIWGAASVGFVALFVVGDLLDPTSRRGPQGMEWIQLLLFPAGTVTGLLVAYVRPRLGGVAVVGSFVAFYALELLTSGSLPSGPWFAVLSFPGLLYLFPSIGAARGSRNRGLGKNDRTRHRTAGDD